MTDTFYRMKHFIFLFIEGLVIVMCFVLLSIPSYTQTKDSVEFEVRARCEPNSEIFGPSAVKLKMTHESTASNPPEIKLFLSTQKDTFFGDEYGAELLKTGTPSKGWITGLFKGPEIVGHTYCQGGLSHREIAFNYYPKPDFRISITETPNITSKEISAPGSETQSSITVPASGKQNNKFALGGDSNKPYWLQFSIKIHSEGAMKTTLFYTFP